MNSTPHSYYSNRISIIELELIKIRKTLSLLFWGRAFAFLLFLVFMSAFIVGSHNNILLCIALIAVVLFLIAIRWDLTYDYKEKVLQNRLIINQNELEYLNHQYQNRSTGQKYSSSNLHLSADFDLFGHGSLFQYLNRCSTKIGTQKFAQELGQFQHNEAIIRERQEAIKELASKNQFAEEFQAHGVFVREKGNEFENLQAWLNEKCEDITLTRALAIAVPITNAAIITLSIIGAISAGWLTVTYFIGLTIMGFHTKRIAQAYNKLDKSAKIFDQYKNLISLIENDDFEAPHLAKLRQQFHNSQATASHSLAKLATLLNRFELRSNFLFTAFINPFILFDLTVFVRLSKWKSTHKLDVNAWFEALAEMDALICYSTFAFNNQQAVTYPQVAENEFVFEASEMGHPLLHPEVRVNNSIQFKGSPSVIIVTGANMAGKSTFLRTLAVNLILAMKGAPVCAQSFKFSPCDIMSSIKIQDSLSNNESYFYAELLRIKDIINHVTNHPKTLVVLDEILRGTNTKDKQQGSLGLLEKLLSLNATVIVATHDLVIGELENKYPQTVANRCFEVELTNDQLIFDYKLKNGISQKLNASFLMKKMGIIE